ncbi:hypothetical protein, partial [Chitinimonas sp.]|uniref:hypothetical protein n=1 Tax=Chitinimonas sp. TaxID=1934313 RepID=UPI0035B3B82C
GLSPLHAVPKNPAIGAGGELNFAGADNQLVLMVMVQPASTYAFWNKQYGSQGERLSGIGNEGFRSKAGSPIKYAVFLKGNTGVWIQSMGWNKQGKDNVSPAQLQELAKLAAARL